MKTQNDLKLLSGRVNSLECVYEDKSGLIIALAWRDEF